MTCPRVEQLLDAFVDTELEPPQLLEVARHAATCAACDEAIRELTALRESVSGLVEREARQLDLSGVWPAVDAAIHPQTPRRARVVALPRALPVRGRAVALSRMAPVWGVAIALAASVLLWLGTSSQEPPPARQVASASGAARVSRPPNHAHIDRLAGKDIAVRREPKSGTTIIWVNQTVEGSR